MNKIDPIRTKISQDYYYMNKVLESCKTSTQVESATSWINSVIDNWDFKVNKLSLGEYHKIYQEIIQPITSNLTAKIQRIYNDIKSIENKPKNIVVKGYS